MSSLRLLYRGEAPVDFPRLWRRALVASATLLVIMAGGTWYIMSDLSDRMHDTDAAMHEAQPR